jgi:predicted AlkP superfamily phosphohydrolase/phosphomutase
VLSDHGFGPLYQAVPLTGWLVEKGYLTYSSKDKRSRGLTDALKFILSRLRLTEGLPPLSILRDIDWTKTKAYFLGVSGDIFINLKGREPQGIVAPGSEYDELIDRMSRELLGMRLPDGSSPVEAVFKGKDLYPDNVNTPDLFIKWAKGFDIVKEGEPDSIVRALRRRSVNAWSGTHVEEGILIMAGPDVLRAELQQARIEDVAPTVYHLLGMPVPKMLEGSVLTKAVKVDRLGTVRYDDTETREKEFSTANYSDDDKRQVEESLRNLGYLD